LLGAASGANSQPQRYHGEIWVGVKGWGGVKLGKGVRPHRSVRCTRRSCLAVGYLIQGPRAVLVAAPYQGWKFDRWHGACKSKRPRCSIDIAKIRPNTNSERNVHVGATFVPAAPGITRDHPIPLGTIAGVGNGWRVRVNSVMPSGQLSPPAPIGAQYFSANVTIAYFGGGSATPEDSLTWQATGSHRTPYNPGLNPCPYPGPQPPLPTFNPIVSGQSATGYVCWQIAANDAGSLEMYFGSGSLDFPGTTWFALH